MEPILVILKYKMQSIERGRGFTLIEVLVVISIIAISFSLIALAINPHDYRRDLEKEARHFETLLSLGIDEAIFKNQELGIKLEEDGFSFLKFNTKTQLWENVEKDRTYKRHQLPGFIELNLVMEDAEIFLAPPESVENKIREIDPLAEFEQFEDEEEEPIKPDIYVFSSGEVTPFELQFQLLDDYDFSYRVSADEVGQVKFTVSDESY